MMMVWKIAPALAAGNTIVLKPSRHHAGLARCCSPSCARSSCRRACSTSSPATATPAGALVEHPTPQMVAITGSVRAGVGGRRVRGRADLKRVHLELGGKAPVIVFDDADIEKAAGGIAEAGYFNAGQDCTAATRVLAGPGVHDDFVAALTEQAKDAKTGHARRRGRALRRRSTTPTSSPGSPAWSTGCPTTPRLETGGHRQGENGYFYEPTVLSGLQPGRRADPGRDLRPGHHRPAVHRRGARRWPGPTA